MAYIDLKRLKLDTLIQPISPLGAWYFRVSPRMITCREFNDFIIEYVEGTLTTKQVTLFKRHMKICPMCRNFLKTYIATYKAKSHIFPHEDIDVPDEVPQDLIDAILAVKQTSSE